MRARLMLAVQELSQWASLPRANKGDFTFNLSFTGDSQWVFTSAIQVMKVFPSSNKNAVYSFGQLQPKRHIHWGRQYSMSAHSLCVKKKQKSTSASARHFSLYNSFHRFLTITHFRSTLLGPLCLTGALDHWMTHRAKNLQFRNGVTTLLLHEFGFPTLHLRTDEPETRTWPSITVFFFS